MSAGKLPAASNRGFLVILLMAVLALAACSDDDAGGQATETAQSAPTAAAGEAEEAPTASPDSAESRPEAPLSGIDIETPAAGAVLDINEPVTVAGTTVVPAGEPILVQALDADGNLLVEVEVSAAAGGDWSADLQVTAAPETEGRIIVSGRSAGGAAVEAEVAVTFGVVIAPFVKIEAPKDGAVLDASQPIIVSGEGGSLFEGNVVVEARDGADNVLVVQPTIVQSPNAGIGGRGPWAATLEVPVSESLPGTIWAYSTSPRDGSIIAQDFVVVTFDLPGEETPVVRLPLAEHLWLLRGYGDEEVLPGAMVTADFNRAGRLAGSAGCNRYTADYEVADEELSIGPAASTRMFCEFPEGLMDQETAYLSLLDQAVAYRLDEEGLLMSDAEGADILFFEAAVTGFVSSRPDEPLPDDARIFIELLDLSGGEATAQIVGEAVVEATGQQWPIPFALTYAPEAVQEEGAYALSVRVLDASGMLLFAGERDTAVLTDGNPRADVQLVVAPVG